jgi:hypothetical protein
VLWQQIQIAHLITCTLPQCLASTGCEDTLGLTFLKNWQGGQSDLCKADCQAQGGGGTAPPPAGQSVFHLRSIPCNKPQAGFHLTALLGSNIQITEPFALLGQPGRDGEWGRLPTGTLAVGWSNEARVESRVQNMDTRMFAQMFKCGHMSQSDLYVQG